MTICGIDPKRGTIFKISRLSFLAKSFAADSQGRNPVLLVLPIRENRSHPWLEAILNLAARMTAVVRGNDSLPAARNPLLSFV
jgi:hypothetical protein